MEACSDESWERLPLQPPLHLQHQHWYFYHKISTAKPFIKNKSLFWLCLQCSRRADFILKCMTHNFMLATDVSNSALRTLHYSRILALLCGAHRKMSCDSTSYSLHPKLQRSVPHLQVNRRLNPDHFSSEILSKVCVCCKGHVYHFLSCSFRILHVVCDE